MSELWAICIKDIRLLLRDRAGFFFTFFFPLIIAVFFGTIFAGGKSGPQKLDVIVVDTDRTPGSRAFIKSLEDGGDFDIQMQPALRRASDASAAPLPLADSDTGGFDSELTREAGIARVRDGDVAACIILPPGFGAAREGPFSGNQLAIDLAADPSRSAASGMLEGILTKYGFQQLTEGFQNPDKMREQTRASMNVLRANPDLTPERRQEFEKFFSSLDSMLDTIPKDRDDPVPSAKSSDSSTLTSSGASGFSPMKINSIAIACSSRGPTNSYDITFPQGIIWGVMSCALGFSMSLVLERTRGTLVRLRAAPIGAWQILGGKGLACFIVTCAVSAILLAVGMAVFKVRPVAPEKVVVAIIATGICFVGIMMLLATFATSERSANGLGWGVLMMCSMVGGGMIPLEFLPTWLAPVSNISPIKWSILAIEGGVWRNLSWHQLALPLGILFGIGVVGFATGMKVMSNAERA
jgi:ABC-2 type transport system permease protein